MSRPLIALTARASVTEDTPKYFDNQSYIDYILAGGGIPVIIPFLDHNDCTYIADIFDGLLITGGEDVDPASYHQINTASSDINPLMDRFDMDLYFAFKKKHKPVFGICRGIQIIAAAEGGTLIQDIPSVYFTRHNQRELNPPLANDHFLHEVTIQPGTRLSDIFQEEHYGVNSFHHQAILDVPEIFTVSAYSEEGIVEAVEADNILAVQWHPERLQNNEKHMRLCIEFINSCRKSDENS